MNRFAWTLLLVAGIGCGACARVQVEAPKDPIKLDIAMRLDVYQHVAKDIDSIESLVSGGPSAGTALSGFFLPSAYAESLDPVIEAAALRRRDRRQGVNEALTKGQIGESRMALLEIRDASSASGSIRGMVEEENRDRMTIFRALAEKNGEPVSNIQRVYSERLQSDAPSGSPVETASGWEVKR